MSTATGGITHFTISFHCAVVATKMSTITNLDMSTYQTNLN